MEPGRERWFIIASGPSLTREDVESLRGQRVLVINDNYLLAPWADVLYACDGHWWDWHSERKEMKEFRGRKITRDEEAAWKYGLEYVKSIDAPGLAKNPNVICEGQNGGIQAINLAYHLGARQVVLLGYDMQATGRWFGEHGWHQKQPDEQERRERYYRTVRHLFDEVAADAREMGLEIINATRETALKCFPRAPLSFLLPVPA